MWSKEERDVGIGDHIWYWNYVTKENFLPEVIRLVLGELKNGLFQLRKEFKDCYNRRERSTSSNQHRREKNSKSAATRKSRTVEEMRELYQNQGILKI